MKDSRRQADPETASAVSAGEEFASVSRRLAALIIDLVVLVVLILIGASLVAAVFGPTVRFHPDATTMASPVTVEGGMIVLNALVSTSLSGAYFVIPWAVLGASPGQLLLRIRVRGATDGGTLTPGRAIARWVLLFPPFGTVAALTAHRPGLGALMWGSALVWYPILLVTTTRSATTQGLHDRIVRSVVRTGASAAGAHEGAMDVR